MKKLKKNLVSSFESKNADMTVPTIEIFNRWTIKQKVDWLRFETGGTFRQNRRDLGYFPCIFYEVENVGIVYEISQAGHLVLAEAMTVNEALDRLSRFKQASDAVLSASMTS